jgi:hypothetical protein
VYNGSHPRGVPGGKVTPDGKAPRLVSLTGVRHATENNRLSTILFNLCAIVVTEWRISTLDNCFVTVIDSVIDQQGSTH